VVGKVEEGIKLAPAVFRGGGEILLLGNPTSGGLGASLYLQEVHGVLAGKPPAADLDSEKKLHQLARKILTQDGLRAIHDVGEGGILWALAEMTFGETPAGAEVTIPCGGERVEEALFGEGGGRILLEVAAEAVTMVEALARESGVAFHHLGRTGGRELRVGCKDIQAAWPVADLKKFYENSLPEALEP
jgi:phosphoribosylformylglycinamidine synthase